MDSSKSESDNLRDHENRLLKEVQRSSDLHEFMKRKFAIERKEYWRKHQ